MSEKKQINPVWAAAKPFVNGGASGMLSTMLIQPIDMVKVSWGGPQDAAQLQSIGAPDGGP